MKKTLQNIVFIGFTSSGKSVTGRLVAERLSYLFVDLDEIVEKHHQQNNYPAQSCREIYARFGPEYFGTLELQALETLANRSQIVISPGGGVLLGAESRNLLKQIGTVIYLATHPDIIFKRMKKKGFPAYLANDRSLQNVRYHWEQRRKIYESIGDFKIDNSHLSPEQTADAVMELFSTHFTIGEE
jgi:shikimate kinase